MSTSLAEEGGEEQQQVSGRAEGLIVGDRFNERNIEEFAEVQRLRNKVAHVNDERHQRPTTWERVFRPSIALYCNFLGLSPSQIIDDRKQTFMRIDDEMIRRKHEELYDRFAAYLKTLTRNDDRRKKLAPLTICTKLTAVRSFYKRNYYPLVEVETPRGAVEKPLHVPTSEELGRMVMKCWEVKYAVAMLAQAFSGMGESELLSLRWDLMSPQFGTIRKQFEDGGDYIHVRMERLKSGVMFDAFLGREVTRWMRMPGFDRSRDRLFDFSIRQWQNVVPQAARDAGVVGCTSPHALRKYFSTKLKTIRLNGPAFGDTIVEYWQGHSLRATQRAYFVPDPIEQLRLYKEAEPRLMPIYPTS